VTIEVSERRKGAKLRDATVMLPVPELILDPGGVMPTNRQNWARLTVRMRESGDGTYCNFAVRPEGREQLRIKVRCGERHLLQRGTTPLDLDVEVIRVLRPRKRAEVVTIERPDGTRTSVSATLR
jgi:hypothetical protein